MVFFMYHELEIEGSKVSESDPGYVRYVVRASDFQTQMSTLKETGRVGVDVERGLKFEPSTVVITFDDGCETDLLVAAPILREMNFGATFYVTTGFLGKNGYLTRERLRELSGLGFQIGSHAVTHAYLPDLDEKSLRHEILDSKLELEQLTGKTVEHFSCPGGRYNQRCIETVRQEGYQTMSTSRACLNFERSDCYHLGRIPIMRETSLSNFKAYSDGRGLRRLRLHESIRHATKTLLGNTFYDRLRTRILNT